MKVTTPEDMTVAAAFLTMISEKETVKKSKNLKSAVDKNGKYRIE